MTVQADQIIAAHEGWQRPGPEEQWSDSSTSAAGTGVGSRSIRASAGGPNEGSRRGGAGRLAARSGLPAVVRARTDCRAVDSLRRRAIRVFEPLHSWELLFEGPGRLFERAEHVATAAKYREVHVTGALSRLGWSALVRLRPLTPVASRTTSSPARSRARSRSMGKQSARRQRNAGPLLGRSRLAARPLLAVVRVRVGSGQLRDAQQRWVSRTAARQRVASSCETASSRRSSPGETESELDPELGCQRSFVARARDDRVARRCSKGVLSRWLRFASAAAAG